MVIPVATDPFGFLYKKKNIFLLYNNNSHRLFLSLLYFSLMLNMSKEDSVCPLHPHCVKVA